MLSIGTYATSAQRNRSGGCHHELTETKVAKGNRAARTGDGVEVDAGLWHLEQLEAVEEPGRRVPEGAGAGVGGEELGRGGFVGGRDARRQARGLVVGDHGRL